MSTEIKVPTLGESVTEATVAKWFKQVGASVAERRLTSVRCSTLCFVKLELAGVGRRRGDGRAGCA